MEIFVPKVLARPQAYRDDALDCAAPLANFYRDQEEGWRPPAQTAVPWLPVPFRDDDNLFQAVALDGDLGAPFATQYVSWTAQVFGTPFAPDEVSQPLANFFLEQEDGWPALTTATIWVARPHLYDETGAGLANFALEQEEGALPAVRQTFSPWTPRPFADESAGVLPTFGLEDERAWTGQVQLWPECRLVVRDDETGAGFVTFGLDQEEGWTGQVQAVAWGAWPFRDEVASSFVAFGPLIVDAVNLFVSGAVAFEVVAAAVAVADAFAPGAAVSAATVEPRT